MTSPVLVIKDLSVTLSRDGRRFRVLDGIGFELFPGEIMALVGESGSGKSSMGLALQALIPGESQPEVTGSIQLAGTELVGAGARALRSARRHLVRAISQDPMGALNPTMTVAMLFVTHDLAAARIIADRIAVLHDGELVEVGDPDALIAAPQAGYTRSLIAAVPRLHAGPT